MVKLGLEFVPRDLYWKTTYYAIQAEKSGFDYIWITDHYNNRNVYVSLAIISAYTDEIKLGPGVTNPYTAHPVLTAQAVASLSEIAPGRVVCGIGAGDKTTLRVLDLEQQKPLTAMREAVQLIRTVSSGEDATFQGEVFRTRGAKLSFKVRKPVPVYVGAQGPKMLALAAEIGDGVLINASNPDDIHPAFKYMREGAEKAGRDLKDIDIAAYTSFSVHKSPDKAVKAATPIVAFIVAGSPEVVLQRHGITVKEAESLRDAIVKEKWAEAFSMVTPGMIDAFSVSGTPEDCVEKISKITKIGVTQFVTGSPIGPNIRKAINLFSKEVLPHFKD